MLSNIITIIKQAGTLVKQIKTQKQVITKTKEDGSFVTNADVASEELLVDGIYKAFGSNQNIVSEEQIANGHTPTINHEPFWLLDPIDSTQSYIEGKPDYCINVTYMVNRQPEIGLIYAPETETLWYAVKNQGAFKQIKENHLYQIFAKPVHNEATAVVSFKGHQLTPELRNKYNIKHELVVASALKFCCIAEGDADYYFRQRNKACDWDIASGHIIVEEAGGKIIIEDKSFKYGVAPYLAPSLVVMGKKTS